MKPSHRAFVVRTAHHGSNEKVVWTEIGAVWPHKNGAGFDLVVHDQIAASGRIVCMPHKGRENGGSGAER
jgi:hypothetical protein